MILGVSNSGSRYRAHIRVGGKKIHLGCFALKEDAESAYLSAKQRMHDVIGASADWLAERTHNGQRTKA